MEQLGLTGILYLRNDQPWSRLQMLFLNRTYSQLGFYYPTSVTGKKEISVILLDEFLLDLEEIPLEKLLNETAEFSYRRCLDGSQKAFRTALVTLLNSLPTRGQQYLQKHLQELLNGTGADGGPEDGLSVWLEQVIELTGGSSCFSAITTVKTENTTVRDKERNSLESLLKAFQEPTVLTALVTCLKRINEEKTKVVKVTNLEVQGKDLFEISTDLKSALTAIEKGETPLIDLNSLIHFHNRFLTDRTLPLLEGSYAAMITSKRNRSTGLKSDLRIKVCNDLGKREILLPTHGCDLSGFNREELQEIALFLNNLKEVDCDLLREEVAKMIHSKAS